MGTDCDIVLATANAKYIHASLALRTLLANLGDHQPRARMLEFTLGSAPADQLEQILAHDPVILGLSVYIWNVQLLTEVVALAKVLAPDLVVVLGGPEVSHGLEGLRIAALADYIVQGEGEVVFQALCTSLLAGEPPPVRVLNGGSPNLEELVLPYRLYSDEDVRQRTIYVEASRGCPYRCEFCLSALETGVRYVPIERLLAEMQLLIDRGCKHFKFIDRTFNLRLEVSSRILSFFLERHQPGMLFHFELVPDRLPPGLRDLVARFPAGSLQFEVGVQSLDAEVGKRISRRQNVEKMRDNFAFLATETGVHVHADLIVGLPGEGLDSFGRGLDQLHAMGVQEIQVGVLKRLRGAPIARHDEAFSMLYSDTPPYEVLRTDALDFTSVQRLKRFAFVWDRLVNRGNLNRGVALLHRHGGPFRSVFDFSAVLYGMHGQVHALSLDRLASALATHLIDQGEVKAEVLAVLAADYATVNRRLPRTLHSGPDNPAREKAKQADRHRRRQLRHAAAPTDSAEADR